MEKRKSNIASAVNKGNIIKGGGETDSVVLPHNLGEKVREKSREREEEWSARVRKRGEK